MSCSVDTFGFREGELLNMRVRQLNLMDRTLMLDPGTTKNDEGRSVVLTNETYELLKASAEGKKADDYLFSRGKKPIRDFRVSWDSLCGKAGVAGLLFHDLRRSAVRNMIRRGVPERVAMMISGHKTRSVLDRYNIVGGSDLADAARRIKRGRQQAQSEFGQSFGQK